MRQVRIVIPYKPRDAFKPLHNRAQRWAVVVAHRRAGKTVACVNDLIRRALSTSRKDGRYAYVAPFYRQAKSVAWDYLKRFSAVIPGLSVNESELRIDYPNGSRIQLFGADNADALRGLFFDGIVADEYGDWKPSVWGYVIRPALADRGGWAIIIGTPKGRNQFHDVYQRAQVDPDWLCMTIKASESCLLPDGELEALRKELTEDAFRQEMECDFDAALPGAFFGKELWQAEQEGRVTGGLYDAAMKTHAVMDLGFSDDTAIWWFQVGKELRMIDCYSNSGMPIAHYNDVLKAKGYDYGTWLWLPHDARAKSLQTGRSIEEQFRSLGWKTRIVPELGLIDGIQAARLSLADCRIDTDCAEGIDALKQYQREYDEDKKCFRDKPRHDWTSHYCLHPETVVLTRTGMRQIMSLPYSGEVLTSCGWKRYVNPRVTRKNAPLVAVEFADGLTVRCTREHMFKTVSGWKCAEHLLPGSLIQSCSTHLHSISMAAYTGYGLARNIYRAAAGGCTERYGSRRLAPFLRGVTFTILTAIRRIMPLPTWSACQQVSTSVRGRVYPMDLATLPANERPTGTDQKLEGFGTSVTQKEVRDGSSGSESQKIAPFAEARLMLWSGIAAIHRCIAGITARPRRIVCVTPLNERSDVWCLTVPDAGEFSLANGAIVHNSDAFRYACLVWREEMKPKEPPLIRFPIHRTINEIMAQQKRKRMEQD